MSYVLIDHQSVYASIFGGATKFQAISPILWPCVTDAIIRCPTADEALLKFMPNRSVQAKTAAKWRDMAKRGPGDQVLPDGDQVLPGGDQAFLTGDQALPGGDQALPGD